MASGGEVGGGGGSLDPLQDETFDFICSLCTSKNKNTEAEKYCVDCQDYYCSICVKFHKDVPALSRHKILNQGQFQPASSRALPAIPTERCERHRHNHVNMYCQIHDVVGCPTCMATEHGSCLATFYIPEFLKNKKSPSAAQATVGSLETIASKLKKYHSDAESRKNLTLKSRDELLQKIKIVRKSINGRLDMLEHGSVKEVEEIFEPVLDKIEDDLKKLQAMEDSVSSAKNNLASSNGNVSQDFVNIKNAEKLARHADNSFTEFFETEESKCDKDFVAYQGLLAQLEKMDVLGQVEEGNKSESEELYFETAIDVVNAEPQDAPTKTTQNDPKSLYQAKGKKKYNIKHHSDTETPSIISACAFEDGTIILADSYNKSLRCIDHITYTVTGYIKVPGVPWKLCVVNKNEVAVSCQSSGVQFVSIKPEMIKTKQFIPDHICYGLVHADSHLYISDKTSVYIYTLSGTKLQQFTGMTDQPEGGWSFMNMFKKQTFFSDINSLSVTNDGSKIYVADDYNGLTVLDRNGMVVGKYNDTKLQHALDVCVMENGRIIVLGNTSKPFRRRNVLEFGPSCELIGEVLKAEEMGRVTLCYNHFRSKLIVTYLRQNKIDVYDILLNE